MENKNTILGIIIFFVFVTLGGVAGIFAGYAVSNNTSEENTVSAQAAVANEEVKGQEEKPQQELAPIELSNLDDMQNMLNVWKEIIERTAEGKLSQKEAGKIIYNISSDIYKRNIPEEFSVYRLKNIIEQSGKGQLKEIQFLNITYDGENIAYADVEEKYQNDSEKYKLKFVKENNNWCFAAQLQD